MNKKKSWGTLKGTWVEPDRRDEVIDFIHYWKTKTKHNLTRFLKGIGISSSKYYEWKKRYGKVNEHNASIPRDCWLEDHEKEAIIDFHSKHSQEGYRRMTYMMMDQDIVAVSPSSVYRVLKEADLMRKWNRKKSKKGTGFKQPAKPHSHWHIDISYINICGTFYYLCGILDGYSRYVIHWEIRKTMKEVDVEIIMQRAREKFPHARPRIISDNGPQFISRDFKEFIRISGMTHAKTSPYYPQSNGKKERYFQTLKHECIRRKPPLDLEDAHKIVTKFVNEYNSRRLHSSIGYIAPLDKLEGRAELIHSERERKLAEARERRKENRSRQRKEKLTGKEDIAMIHLIGEKDASSAGKQLARDSRLGFRHEIQAGGV